MTTGCSQPAVLPSQPIVLVVDDSPVDRRLAGTLLEKDLGCKALYAGNGVEALAVMERELPTVVLTDLLMPEMDGVLLVQALRRRYPQVPIILMTAHGSEAIAIRALLFFVLRGFLVFFLIHVLRCARF